jgi:putative phage-type endonuclease
VRDCTVIDCEQRSPEWSAARCGRLTASRAADMLSKTAKGEWAAGRKILRTQLLLERVTGKSQDSGGYQSQAMKDGADREPDSLLMYEAITGTIITRTGFISHDVLMVGASLDGMISDFEGLVEAKCPIPATHLEYLKSGKVPGEYLKQIRHQLWVTGAQWCDFMSFCPSFPEHLQVKLVRVYRDETDIAEYAREVRTFLAEVDQEVSALLSMTNLRGQLAASVA